MSNEEIAAAYRRAIEVLWKFLKTHLKLDKMMSIAKHTKVDMIWVAGRGPTLVSQNLKATTLTYLAILSLWLSPLYLKV